MRYIKTFEMYIHHFTQCIRTYVMYYRTLINLFEIETLRDVFKIEMQCIDKFWDVSEFYQIFKRFLSFGKE